MSWSENAWSPGNVEDPAALAWATAVSNSVVPVRKVESNAASSEIDTLRMRSTSSFNSGYCGAIAKTVASTSSLITGCSAPRMRMFRITRRIRRRST